MSWSTTIRVEAGDDDIPILTDEHELAARAAVLDQLDAGPEHDTFDAAVAAARELLDYGPGTRIVTLAGYKTNATRSCSVTTVVPAPEPEPA